MDLSYLTIFEIFFYEGKQQTRGKNWAKVRAVEGDQGVPPQKTNSLLPLSSLSLRNQVVRKNSCTMKIKCDLG